MWKRRQEEAFPGRPFHKGYLPTVSDPGQFLKHPVARPRFNVQIAQGNGPWLELGDLGIEVGVCRGKGYTLVAVHCIKDPGLWGWSLGSSQSCHFRMGLCLPARDRRKKKKKPKPAGQNSQTTHSCPHTQGPTRLPENSLSIRGYPQGSMDSAHTPGPRSLWPTVASPTHRKPLTARAVQQLHDPEAVVQQGFGPHQLQA